MEFEVKYRGRVVDHPSKAIANAAAKLSPANLRRIEQYAEQEMRKYLTRVSDALHEKHSGAWPGGTTKDTLSKRSGKGLQSVKNFRVVNKGGKIEGQMRLNKYMAMHEHGGWIRAKNSTYLTIPLPPALNANGTPKKRRARDWQNTFVITSRRGNLLIVQKAANGGITPLYVLKKKVRIPARLGMRKELRAQRPEMRKNIQARIRELFALQRRE